MGVLSVHEVCAGTAASTYPTEHFMEQLAPDTSVVVQLPSVPLIGAVTLHAHALHDAAEVSPVRVLQVPLGHGKREDGEGQ